jgi:hypothetical protein
VLKRIAALAEADGGGELDVPVTMNLDGQDLRRQDWLLVDWRGASLNGADLRSATLTCRTIASSIVSVPSTSGRPPASAAPSGTVCHRGAVGGPWPGATCPTVLVSEGWITLPVLQR